MTRFVALALLCSVTTLAFADDVKENGDALWGKVLWPSDALDEKQRQRVNLVDAYLARDPQPVIDGNRLTYLYGEGLPSLVCAPLRVCTLALAPGERIAENGILIGDPTRWEIVQAAVTSTDEVHLAFKPVNAGLRTSLSILSEGKKARHYHLELISDPVAYMPLVSFRYESQAMDDINAMIARAQNNDRSVNQPRSTSAQLPFDYGEISLDDLNFDYDVSGCRNCVWRPERVFDDGVRTIIVLSEDAATHPLPAFFVVGSESSSQVANYRFTDRSYIVDQLFDEARLRLGVGRRDEVVSIKRKRR